jgi:hypothetical protein
MKKKVNFLPEQPIMYIKQRETGKDFQRDVDAK